MKLVRPTLEQANAVIDDYVRDLQNPDIGYFRATSRTALEFTLQKHGLIPEVRQMMLGDSHALWYACLVLTKRVREVSRLESAKKAKMGRTPPRNGPHGRTTEGTIRKLLKGNLRQNHVASLLTGLLLAEEKAK